MVGAERDRTADLRVANATLSPAELRPHESGYLARRERFGSALGGEPRFPDACFQAPDGRFAPPERQCPTAISGPGSVTRCCFAEIGPNRPPTGTGHSAPITPRLLAQRARRMARRIVRPIEPPARLEQRAQRRDHQDLRRERWPAVRVRAGHPPRTRLRRGSRRPPARAARRARQSRRSPDRRSRGSPRPRAGHSDVVPLLLIAITTSPGTT